jgi:hypothetical protein
VISLRDGRIVAETRAEHPDAALAAATS